MADVGGLLTAAVVKIAAEKLGAAIGGQASLLWNFTGDLGDMSETLESISAVLEDAERQSVKEKSVRLWLKRLKDAAYDISDIVDDYQLIKATAKMPRMLSCFPIARKKVVLANKMKNMRERLRKINEQRLSFTFTSMSTCTTIEHKHYDPRETASYVNASQIIGRDEEKKEIISILSANENKLETMILPIYGLGGMGKSTLAQLVCNDAQFRKYDHRVWVYVSQDFDLMKIGSSIISQVEGSQQNINTMELINQHLDVLLPGKKILIVLDDIWVETDFELQKLKDMLRVEKKDSMLNVIVTTRKEHIANTICTNKAYKLQPLDDYICWDIIKRSSGSEDIASKGQLEQIGLNIARKCGGVALAAKAIGYMLKSKDLNEWSEINNSDIWNGSSEDENSQHKKVLPSLKLSYERMPPQLRLCFSYCAIFSKGHDIIEDDLIHQWISLDFIDPSKGKKYMKELLGMCFLQHSKLASTSEKQVVRYTMHDLVHDLARSVMDDELVVFDIEATKSKTSEQKYCRYALLTSYDWSTKLSITFPRKVRALQFSDSGKLSLHDASLSFAKFLRILDFSECSSILLPVSVGKLNHLRCLIAPRMQNEKLPDCITELSKLQYLNLHGSCQLLALPESIGKLGSLKYLDLSGCSGISKLPESFGDLKGLMHLDLSGCSGIGKLTESFSRLDKLLHLDMSGCSEITELPDSLGNLTNLQHLDLCHSSGVKALPESLYRLTKLQYLNLSCCYCLERLPEAIGSLINLVDLNMSRCRNIKELPESFANLRNLENLDLSSFKGTKGLPRALRGLLALRHLNMSHFSIDNSVIEVLLDHGGLPDALGNLTNLKYLNLSRNGFGLFGASKSKVTGFIGNLTNLEHLDLSQNGDIDYLPESIGNLKRLHTLDLSYCWALWSLPKSISAIRLKSFVVEGCNEDLMAKAGSLLDYSLMLPLFMVRADYVRACSNLHQLEGVDVGELHIYSLENVMSLEEARRIKLLEKQKLSELALAWSWHSSRVLEDMDVLGQLVPPRYLKCLRLEGYSSTMLPSWFMGISHHLPSLVRISLCGLPTCSNLPPLGHLPNLEELTLKGVNITKIDIDFCGGKGTFRRLSSFSLRDMTTLEEWSTTYCGEDGVEEFVFPALEYLSVEDCRSLRLKPRPPRFRECILWRCDQLLSSLEKMDNISHLPSSIPSTRLEISSSNFRSLRLLYHFPALQNLRFEFCNLTSLPESMRQLASLQHLELVSCHSLTALPEFLGDLTSLRSIHILGCKTIKSLPPCMRQLTKLQRLHVSCNNELENWCKSEENKTKLAHIKIIYSQF